jgi:uncharacterized protein YhaN
VRIRLLELVRYGAFADRLLDFGSVGPDLHIVLGPNEAGKSTTLQAIGDFLFGIAGQTTQGWRWSYGDLRIRGVLEHPGGTIEAVRRKGNKDTLLAPDGTPVAGDPIAPLLQGIDRAAFERMFGLDHARLRAGGDAILRGRDDAARITLEAGTGVAGIGRELDRFADSAAGLFKPSASKPLINRLMAERGEALKLVRETAISDRDWTDEKRRRAEAEDRRAALLAEADALSREEGQVNRVSRARAPLSRLHAARRRLDALGQTAGLPVGSAERLATARSDRRAAGELEVRLMTELDRIEGEARGMVISDDLLALRSRIEKLDELRPVVEKASRDLTRRMARREEIDDRLAAARIEAGLAADVDLPGASWRRRASTYLQERRDVAATMKAAMRRRDDHAARREALVREREALPVIAGVEAIEAAITDLPPDVEEQLARTKSELDRRRERLQAQLDVLRPWTGSGRELASLVLPSAHEASNVAQAVDVARTDARAARRDAEMHRREVMRADSRLAVLEAGNELPTRDAVDAARRERDDLITQLLRQEIGSGDLVRNAVERADRLADRRDADAERLAEHASLTAARQLAERLAAEAAHRAEACEADAAELMGSWDAKLVPLGFTRSLSPAEFPAWAERRLQALATSREVDEAALAAAAAETQIDEARAVLSTELTLSGLSPPAGTSELASLARQRVRLALEADARRRQIEDGISSADGALASARREVADEELEAARLDAVRAGLLDEARIPGERGEIGLADAVAAFDGVADDLTSRIDLDRQIAGIARDAESFEAEANAVAMMLGREGGTSATQTVAEIASELRRAMASREGLTKLDADRRRLEADLRSARARKSAAEEEVAALMQLAAVQEEALLDAAIAAASERAQLQAIIDEAVGELAALDEGGGIEALFEQVLALPAEDEAVARRRIAERREAVATEREDIGRALADSDEAFNRAARSSAAADALQAATDAGAAIASAAESHVEAAAAAAMLRWALDRHRRLNQAPLIDRAGDLFATVTKGAFQGLQVAYDDDDRPVIRAVRADGQAIGVEGLSEGTRDQLYLALRLGSIDVGGHSMPIVCDDLLVTADDARAGEMLRVLAAAAKRTQVLLFTHHEHLIEVARRSLGIDGFKLHRLEPVDQPPGDRRVASAA